MIVQLVAGWEIFSDVHLHGNGYWLSFFGVFFFLDYGVSITVPSSLQILVALHPVDHFVAVAFVFTQSH